MNQPSSGSPSPTDSYFDRPISSLTTTLQSSSSTPESPPLPRQLRLFFSGRDLPEPDARSRASYAVVYHAQETPAGARTSSVSDASLPPTPLLRPAGLAQVVKVGNQQGLKRQSSAPALVRAISRPVGKMQKAMSTAQRAPGAAGTFAAPEAPELVVGEDGAAVLRSAWTKLGTTEVARKHGRDVEFARGFAFHFVPGTGQVIRVAFFDCTSKKVEKQRLIGTAQLRVSAVYAAKGRPVTFPLKFLPVTKKDVKRSTKIPDGALVVAAGSSDAEQRKYRIDVECNRIVRAKALSVASVKRTFYTIHAVLDKGPKSDFWTLVFRSNTVEMIHRKQDGGSLEYNYFTSRRLIAKPGVVIEDTEGKERDRVARIARGEVAGSGSGSGVLTKVGKLIGIKQKERFFSLPGADLHLADDTTRLKLSLFEDNGLLAGYDVIADTEFSIADLKTRELGGSSPIRVHANTVGKAALKYVECSHDPGYFCLSLLLHGLR